jgi:transmembrane sensor
MLLPNERIAYLLEAYTAKKATAAEEHELMEWLQEAQDDAALKKYIENLWNNHQAGSEANAVDWDSMFNRVLQGDKVYSIAPPAKIKRANWPRIAAAAAILILLGSAAFWLWPADSDSTSIVENGPVPAAKDVAPPITNKATLTLANGKVIVIGNTAAGPLNAQGVSNASKVSDGELAYSAQAAGTVEYHTLRVPKGSKPMQLQLADGSAVWLNAASSITFPNLFAGPQRTVSVTGEVYFEVKHDAGHPFIVSKGTMQVQVLGTKFNINAYDNDADMRVTLLNGSVKVIYASSEALLQPGQQARLTNNNIKVQDAVDTDEVMAWKNGLFEFKDTDIQTIMRQVERWYDVEVIFEGNVTQHFNGTIERQVNVSKLLNMLEKTGGIRFAIEGKKVIVRKY